MSRASDRVRTWGGSGFGAALRRLWITLARLWRPRGDLVKLLNCLKCGDIVRLYGEWRACACGACVGRYATIQEAHVSGPARVLGLRNPDYARSEPGGEYPWFVIPPSPGRVRIVPRP